MPDPACQSKSLGFETKVVRDGSAIRHCTQCRPRKGGTGIPVAGHPYRTISIKEKRVGLSGKQFMHPFYQLFNINNIYKTQNYIKIAIFFPFF